MKKFLYTGIACLFFATAAAQQDPARQFPDQSKTKTDSARALQAVDPKNIQKSDAVKTQDHPKSSRKAKSTARDSTKAGKGRNR